MKRVRKLFSNTVILLLVAALAIGLTILLSHRAVEPITQQDPTVTITSVAATKTPSSVPTATPMATETPVIIPVIITVPPSPTPAPTSTPFSISSFERQAAKSTFGFVFKPPQEIPNTQSPDGFDIVDWLPGSSEEVLLKGAFTLEAVNILDGAVKVYATVNEPGNIWQPVWLPEVQGVAYISLDIQTGKQNLMLGQGEGSKTALLSSNASLPLIPLASLKQGNGLAVFSQDGQRIRRVSSDGTEADSLPASFNALLRLEQKTAKTFHYIAIQPDGNWFAYYNSEDFQLFNHHTGEIREIDLGGSGFEKLWVMYAKWSPDGQKLALIVTTGATPIDFSNLYILDWSTGKSYKVNVSFNFVTDIAWAPDSKHLLFEAVVDQKEGSDINALFITNISTSSEILPVPVSITGLGSNFGGGLSWSVDGRTILAKYANDLGVALYRIEVTAP